MLLKRLTPHLGLILVLAVALVLVGYFIRTELELNGDELGVPLDDAWIHFQFARNLSLGDGFSYNPGEPTPGSTSPLWTLLLASVNVFTTDLMIPALLLSVGFFLLTIAFTYGFVHQLLESKTMALLAALAVALTGRLLWASLAGMETTAFAAVSLVAVWIYSRQGLSPLAALAFGLASQIRPEAHLLFGLAVLDLLWESAWKRRETRPSWSLMARKLLAAVLIYGLIAAPYIIFSLSTTGRPLPNTFYAKVASERLFSWRTLIETVRLHLYDNPVALFLLPLGISAVWRRSRLTLVWLLALPVVTAMLVEFVWHHGRYTMPLIPFQMVVAAAGAHWLKCNLVGRAQELPPTPSNRRTLLLLPLLFLVIILGGLWRVPRWAEMLGNNVREIQEIDVALGRWLAINTPPEALIAVDDIGAITYLSGRRIVDTQGLVSPEMWPAVQEPVGLPRNRRAAKILSTLAPDYLVGFPLWHWEIVTDLVVAEPVHRVETATRTIIAEQEALVYRVSWPYVETAFPHWPVSATLGGVVQLLGYDMSVLTPGQPLSLILYWQSLEAVDLQYDVFIHVVNDQAEIAVQIDQQPVHGLAATHMWQPGDIIRDPYRLQFPADLPAGTYRINTGMYLPETGARLPVYSPSEKGDSITLAIFEWQP